MSEGAGEVVDRFHGDAVDGAFGLDDVLPTDEGLGVVGDTVHPAVAGGTVVAPVAETSTVLGRNITTAV